MPFRVIPIRLIKCSILRLENVSVARQKIRYSVVLNENFLTRLASQND